MGESASGCDIPEATPPAAPHPPRSLYPALEHKSASPNPDTLTAAVSGVWGTRESVPSSPPLSACLHQVPFMAAVETSQSQALVSWSTGAGTVRGPQLLLWTLLLPLCFLPPPPQIPHTRAPQSSAKICTPEQHNFRCL